MREKEEEKFVITPKGSIVLELLDLEMSSTCAVEIAERILERMYQNAMRIKENPKASPGMVFDEGYWQYCDLEKEDDWS